MVLPPSVLPSILLLLPLCTAQTATIQPTPLTTPTLTSSNTKYVYQGCYNETTGLDGTGGGRALANGINEVKIGQMTVPMCLDFCSQKGGTVYQYAGLEYSRECWCAQYLSGASEKMDEAECNLPCAGNGSVICGGTGKLSVSVFAADVEEGG
jgi:hypothetical protein